MRLLLASKRGIKWLIVGDCRLGIGGKIQNDDEVDRQKLSSNNQLKRHLLGRDFEKRERADRKGQQKVLASRTAVNGRATLRKPLPKVEVDSDEDAGRSSLGKLKRKRPFQTEEHAAMSGEANEKDKERTLSDDVRPIKDAVAPTQQQNGTYGDMVSAERLSKKRKRKSKEKRQEVEECNLMG